MCKSWCELILAIVVIVFALWQTAASKWILLVAGIVLLIHSMACKGCFSCETGTMKSSSRKKR